ncbi:hypothetical protein BDZ91DRAFT_760045 [Kalaharituber pfeilii]|nr:hypothetical protein BDZ91DRAFT_760045 [Kalaharituber pfeilii]
MPSTLLLGLLTFSLFPAPAAAATAAAAGKTPSRAVARTGSFPSLLTPIPHPSALQSSVPLCSWPRKHAGTPSLSDPLLCRILQLKVARSLPYERLWTTWALVLYLPPLGHDPNG